LLSVITGLLSVFLLAHQRVIGFPIGFFNIFFSAILYYQVGLLADMFLQAYFFVTSAWGWYVWLHPRTEQANESNELQVQTMPRGQWLYLLPIILLMALLLGSLINKLPEWLPQYFSTASIWTYPNALMVTLSLVGEWLLARKYIENWYMWLLCDVIAVVVYFNSGVYFLALEYAIFLLLSVRAIMQWKQTGQKQNRSFV
jgi:nicotinamide mononucleotide transporter